MPIAALVRRILSLPAARCPDGLLPAGPECPRCGGERGTGGFEGQAWVHYTDTGTVSAPAGSTP